MIKVATAQFDATANSIKKNYNSFENFVIQAGENDVSLIVFPELVDYGYYLASYKDCRITPWKSFFTNISKLSKSYNIDIVFGGALYNDGKLYNSLFWSSSKSMPTPVYYKNHLFPGEEEYFTSYSACESQTIRGVETGFHICYDLRFPELTRLFIPKMPELLIISAAWPLARIEHWKKLLSARAIENQCYIIASNRIGTDNNLTFGGNSMIISPDGEVLTSCSESDPEVAYVHIDIAKLREFRKTFPVLSHSRFAHNTRKK